MIDVTYPGAGYPAGEPGAGLSVGTPVSGAGESIGTSDDLAIGNLLTVVNGDGSAIGTSDALGVGNDNTGEASAAGTSIVIAIPDVWGTSEGVSEVLAVGGAILSGVASSVGATSSAVIGSYALAAAGHASGLTTVLGVSLVKRTATGPAAFTYLPPNPAVWTGRIRR